MVQGISGLGRKLVLGKLVGTHKDEPNEIPKNSGEGTSTGHLLLLD